MTATLPPDNVAAGDVTLWSDSDASGAGDIIFKNGASVRARLSSGTLSLKPPSGDGIKLYQSDGTTLNLRITDSTPGAMQQIFYGANGGGPNNQAWAIGMDSSLPGLPGRDFTVPTRINADGSNSDPDGIYISYNGGTSSTPASLGIGFSQPAATYRLRVAPGTGDLTQGALAVHSNAGQTGSPLVVFGGLGETNPVFNVQSDFSVRSKSSPANRTVADGVTTNTSATVTSATAAFDLNDLGRPITGTGIPVGAYISGVTNATTVTISDAATATATGVSVTVWAPHFSFINTANQPLLLGTTGTGALSCVAVPTNMSVGSGAPPNPTATLDVVQISTGNATLKVRTRVQGSFQIIASGTAATVTVQTANASSMILQTNATTRLTIGASGGFTFAEANDIAFGTTTGTKIGTATTQKLAFFNATPIVQPSGTPVASTDLASVISLANSLRTNLLALGLVA